MKVEFRNSFANDLKSIRDKVLLNRVRELIGGVERAETLAEISNLKKLRGPGGYYRARLGDYRVGIALEGDSVIFVRCLNRKDIYRYFP